MAEAAPSTRLWLGRAGYLVLALVLIALSLAPFETLPRRWAPPDLLLAVTMAWAVRRPDHVPLISVAAVFLIADLLFQRPPGLMAAVVVLAVDRIVKRGPAFRAMPYGLEWASVALAMTVIVFVQRIALAVMMLPRPSLALSMIELALTVAVYPLVTMSAYLLFGVSRRAPGEIDSLGHKI